MNIRAVERHKRGWAVVEKTVGGLLVGMKTVLSVWKTKAEVEEHKNDR